MESNKGILEELILDESFQNYVLHQQYGDKWENWQKGHPENLRDFEEAVDFVKALKFQGRAVSQSEIQNEITRFDQRARQRPGQHSAKIIPLWKQLSKIAAAVLLVAGLSYVFHDVYTTAPRGAKLARVETIVKTAPAGVKSQTKLPDGTLVKLNSGSTIKYPSRFNGNSREVEFEGEAYFEVVSNKSKPFIVNTANMKTTVLGTSFVVNTLDKEKQSVSLLEGSVRVSAKEGQRTIQPGEQFTLHGQTILVQAFDYNEAFAWKEGRLNFKEAGAQEVFDKLRRWYGVEFHFQDNHLPALDYTGFYTKEDLETVLAGLAYSLKFDYEIEGKQINIKFK